MMAGPQREAVSWRSEVMPLVLRLWDSRWWIVASVLVCTAAFTTLALVTTPVYRASTVLVPASSERGGGSGSLSAVMGQLGGVASVVGISGENSETQEALAVLRSQEFTEQFIRDRGLLDELVPKKDIFGRKIYPTLGKAYKLFDQKIRTINEDYKTGLVTLQIDWRDRTEAADWANELVSRLNEKMRQRDIQDANESVKYLEAELRTTSLVATQDAISRLIEVQVKRRMIANVTKEYVFRVADRALPPDVDDPVRPKRRLMIGGGVLFGLLASIVAIVATDSSLRANRRERSRTAPATSAYCVSDRVEG